MRLAQPKKTNLNVYRRHDADCPHRDQGREYLKCSCPLWVQGTHAGEPIRQSLQTRRMQEAQRQVTLLEDPHAPLLKPLAEALAAYKNHIMPLAAGTRRRYAHALTPLAEYCERAGLKYMADVTVEEVDHFRAARQLAASTASHELVILRLFFSFCAERKWSVENPAKRYI